MTFYDSGKNSDSLHHDCLSSFVCSDVEKEKGGISEVMWECEQFKSLNQSVQQSAFRRDICSSISPSICACRCAHGHAVCKFYLWISNLQGGHEEDAILSCLLVSPGCSVLLNRLPIVKAEGFAHNRMRVETVLAWL